MLHRTRAGFSLSMLVLLAAGCGGDSFFGDSGPGPSNPKAERHGTSLVDAWGDGDIAWSAVSNEIAYIGSDRSTAYARNMDTGARRTIFTAGVGRSLSHVAFGRAGTMFTVEQAEGSFTLRMHTGSQTDVITSNADFSTPSVVQSETGDVIYLEQPDILYLRRADGTRRLITGNCGAIGALAPAGDEVLCSNEFTPEPLHRVALATGQATIIDTQQRNPMRALWNAAGLHVLLHNGSNYVFLRPQGALVTTPAYTYPEYTLGHVAISPDAAKLAWWTYYCAQSDGFLGCAKWQYVLYVMNVATGKVDQLAVHTAGNEGVREGATTFSPDGTRVAYIVGNRLFVIPTF